MDVFTLLQTFDWHIAAVVLAAYAVVDALYALYTVQVVEARPTRAATTGAIMHILIALGVLSYTENILYILPIACGSWIGTYCAVRYAPTVRSS